MPNTKNNNTNAKVIKYVDVKKVIASKSKTLPRLIPGFLLRYLKRIIREEELNLSLTKSEPRKDIDFANFFIKDELKAKVITFNEDNLLKSKRFIVVANHPLGGFDGVALISSVGKYIKNIVFPVNDLLMNLGVMNNIFIPINKHGKNSIEVAKKIDTAFASDKTVLYFPAGLCSRKQKGEIRDIEWKKTIIDKAKKHKRDIIPTYIEGQNSRFFYNLANLRKFFRIKFNIEMLYLANEVYKQKGKTLKIYFGEPIPYTMFDNSKKNKEWAEYLKNIVYNIPKKY